MYRQNLLRLVALSLLFPCLAVPSRAQSTSGLSVERVATGLNAPVFVTAQPGDTSRIFIVQQGGGGTASIRILDLTTNTLNPTPFLTLSGLATGGELGLLGMAFDPASPDTFYLHYTTPVTSGSAAAISNIVRYDVSANPNLADAGSATTILTLEQPQTNHNGGWLGFSPRPGDGGNLYIALGDGGNGNDQGPGHLEPKGNAQDTATLLGKILRINVHGTGGVSGNPNYAIPTDNPFAGSTTDRKEIWALGLRNPYRAGFDRLTGRLFVGDVGQGAREEIDVQNVSNPGGGENYGWRLREGTIATPSGSPQVGGTAAGLTDPIFDYDRTVGRTVIGGYVYRGTALPALQGEYIFADYLGSQDSMVNPNDRGRIFGLKYNGASVSGFEDLTSGLFSGTGFTLDNPSSLGEDANGELYITDIADGEVYRIVPEPSSVALLLGAALAIHALALRRRVSSGGKGVT